MSDPLEQLRPLHQPLDISWWPPAPGWWLLLVLMIAALAWFFLRPRPRTMLQTALYEVEKMEIASDMQFPELASKSNQLLKRYALTRYPEDEIAGLSGKPWIDFLQEHTPEDCDASMAEVLVESAYKPTVTDAPREKLLSFTRDWIKAQQAIDKKKEAR